MRLPRVWFTVRRMMVAVAGVAFMLGILVSCLRWLQYPHIDVTIFNETSAPISDVRLGFLYGERTAERLRPDGIAVTEIQSGGDAGIHFSYRESGGAFGKSEPLYYESGDSGFLEVHVTNQGVRLVNGIYPGVCVIPILGVRRVQPTGQMTVE